MSKRRLVISCDGTWNNPQRDAVTHIERVHRQLQSQNEADLIAGYVKGVGSALGSWIRGGLFGYGLSHNVIEAYRFLVEHYQPDDAIYVFGFSRGAFTARSLLGLIYNVGLIKREFFSEKLMRQAYCEYRHQRKPQHPLAQAFRRRYAHADPSVPASLHNIPIRFLGVYDTVAALGMPFDPLRLNKKWGFHDARLNPLIQTARHALAIDEQRKQFKPALWQATDITESNQRWFVGDHADVGGGHYQQFDLSSLRPVLCERPLHWMLQQANAYGLGVDADFIASIDPDKTAYRGTIHNLQAHFPFDLLGSYHRPIGQHQDETLDDSVKARYAEDESYRPLGLACNPAG